MKRQVITYSQKKFIDKTADEYVLMDYYINKKSINKYVKDKALVIGFPFETDDDIIVADEYIFDLTKRVIASYVEPLNSYNGIDWSYKSWEKYMFVWMRFVLFDSYMRYRQLKQLLMNDTYISAPMVYKVEYTEADSVRTLTNSEWKNAFMWGLIASMLDMEIHPIKEKSSFDCLLDRIAGCISNPQRIIRYIKRRCSWKKKNNSEKNNINITNISSEVTTLLFATSLDDMIENEIIDSSDGRVGRIDCTEINRMNRAIIYRYEYSYERRNDLFDGKFHPKNEFEAIAEKIVRRFLPVSYLEAFNELYKKASEIVDVWSVQEYFTSYIHLELMDICAILQSEKGMKSNVIQHSAVYGGMSMYHIDVSAIADRFFTWGWNRLQLPYLSAEIVPGAIIRFPIKPQTEYCVKNKILLACNYGMYSDGGLGFYYGDYVDNQIRFLEKLNEDILRRIVIRVNFSDSMNNELILRCKEKFPYIKVEDRFQVPYVKSIMESSLVICDYYGSTHLEAMLYDRPFVLFEAAKVTVPSEEWISFRERFKEHGIYGDSPEEMASILNRRIDDIICWKDKDIKVILKEYLKMFAGTEKNIWNNGDTEVYSKWKKIFTGEADVY